MSNKSRRQATQRTSNMNSSYNIWLHRFAKLVAASTFVLIFIGGLVTSTGSGLAVPDWPNTYGQFMFSFPLSKMVGGILYEHGHRMIASIVGFLTVVLAVWLWIKEPRKWLKWFGGGALLAVIVQGVLGGLTVLFLLPTPISVLHGTLAQVFFCMTICLAVFTSKGWLERKPNLADRQKPNLQNLALLTTGVVFLQLILGAIMRHTGSGLAIPDFPLAFGKIIPPIQSQQVAIHFLHRIGAVLVSISVVWTCLRIFRSHRSQPTLIQIASVLLSSLVLQILLAGITIWTKKAVIPTTAHVATGAFILGTSIFLTLQVQMLFKTQQKKASESLLVEQTP
ncbi:MAG: heme A synthase [Caldithrix sp.]|nr:MAG: heme A synthase [Caldithrix sp.]